MKHIKLKGNERILIIRPDRIGDLVLTLPVAAVIKNIYPGITIDFLVSSYNFPVLKYADYINGYLRVDDGRAVKKTAGNLIAELQRNNYDVAIFARPDLFTAFCVYLAGIQYRVGTLRRGYTFLFNIRPNVQRRYSATHEVDLNLSLLGPFGISTEPGKVNPVLKKPDNSASIEGKLKGISDYLVIHPGSKGSAPNWPAARYTELIKRLAGTINVVVSGQGEDIYSGLHNVTSVINKTDFTELVSVLSKAKLFVSGSTGPVHVAAALGVPVAGFYPDHQVLGPHRWGPRGNSVMIFAPQKQSGHVCRIKDNGSCSCLETITVDFVYESLMKIIM